jgi:hypothetical protein
MKYWPIKTNGTPQIMPKVQTPLGSSLWPHHPATPASQKIAKPPQRRLKGTVYQSAEWKITEGFGIPDQKMLSPDISSGWELHRGLCEKATSNHL